jgi:hypothetical protein
MNYFTINSLQLLSLHWCIDAFLRIHKFWFSPCLRFPFSLSNGICISAFLKIHKFWF